MSRHQSTNLTHSTQTTKVFYVAGARDATNLLISPLRFGTLQLPDEERPLSFHIKPFIPTQSPVPQQGVLVIAYNTHSDASFSEMFSQSYAYQQSELSLIVVGFVNTEDPSRHEKANIEDGEKFAEQLGAVFFKIKNARLPLQADSPMAKLYRLIAEQAQSVRVRFLDPIVTNHRPEDTHDASQMTTIQESIYPHF